MKYNVNVIIQRGPAKGKKTYRNLSYSAPTTMDLVRQLERMFDNVINVEFL